MEVKTTVTVNWRVNIPRQSLISESPKFNFLNSEWYLHCFGNISGSSDIGIKLSRTDTTIPLSSLFSVTVQVKSVSGRLLPTLSETKTQVRGNVYLWKKFFSDVVQVDPGFDSHRWLTFILTLKANGSDTQEVMDFQKSVQTSLCVNPIPSFESLSDDFAKLLLDADSHPDVEFHCEGQVTKAHSLVLSVRSRVLTSMLKSNIVEGRSGVVKIEDMSHDALQHFVRYLYTGKLDEVTFDTAVLLYEAGEKYEVKSLARWCAQYLIENLTVENACDVLDIADAHSDKDFVESVINFILVKKVTLSAKHSLPFCDSHQLQLANLIMTRYLEMYGSYKAKTEKNQV